MAKNRGGKKRYSYYKDYVAVKYKNIMCHVEK